MSKVVRSVKNVTKGYSSVQVKVRDATSNDAWGPTGAQMSEIAQMTFNGSNDFYEIMDMLDKRLNDKGKNWRHVLKSLKVLDYCLHEGSELVVTWARKNIYIIKTLREFQYLEDDSHDVGQNVRTSAKELTALIMDEERLRAERADRKTWKSRVTGIDEYGPSGSGLAGVGEGSQRRPKPNRRENLDDENDLEMRLAIEASKNEAEEDKKRRQSQAGGEHDEDLQKAIKLSKEEEELRRRELENQNAQSLFDDTPAPASQQPQNTGWNQGYQQGGAVDLFGNPVYQQGQQQQNTGYLDNAYSQFQPQQTGFQNGFTGQQQMGFDPNQQFQQQQQNFLQAQQTVQPQQNAFSTLNPYQQNTDFNQFQQQQQQQQQQQTLSPATVGTNNPWGNNQQNQMEALKPAPTGSNNPFGAKFGQPQQQQQQQNRQPTLNTLAEQRQVNQFTQPSNPNPIANYVPPQPQPQFQPQQQQQQQQQQPLQYQQTVTQPKQELDPQRAKLNALLASGEGMDTFGNTGELRIPAQHTAPGTFVNSSGQNLNRLHAAQTGNNPFFSQNTGMPQQQQQQQQQQQAFGQSNMLPAQTGPAGMNGGFGFAQGSNNPFGGQQRQQNQGSLIDL